MLAQKASKLHSAGKFSQAEKIYRRLLKANPNDVTLIRVLGMLERDRKNHNAAITWFELAKQLSGNNPIFLAEIGLTKLNQGKLEDAYKLAKDANEGNPKDLDIAIFFAKVCLAYGHATRAMNVIEHAIETNPTHHEAMQLLATSAVESGIIPVPMERIQQLIRMRPNDAKAHATLGIAHRLNGDSELALESLDRSLDIDPNQHDAIASKAEILVSLGKPEEAISALSKVNTKRSVPLTLAGARAHKVLGDPQSAIESINKLNLKSLSPKQASNVLKELGKLQDSQSQYDKAWSSWKDANTLQATPYDVEQHLSQIQSIIDTPCKKYEQSSSTRPIFIVGMYRSGTTLLEQILSSHSQITAMGEVDEFLRFVSETPYPDCCTEPEPDWADRYLKRTASDTPFTTDKMPMNYLHIGLIKSVFPNAAIIHVKRHPLDTFVSCYSNSFAATHAYTKSAHEFKAVYNGYLRIMEHWNSIFNDIIEIDYESLASQFEETLNSLCDKIGVDAEEACIHFYNNTRIAQTPSIDQVRLPMYTSSIGRWKNYEQYLEDLIDLQ